MGTIIIIILLILIKVELSNIYDSIENIKKQKH